MAAVYEIDNNGIRIYGTNKGLSFYSADRTLRQQIYLKDDNTLNIGGTSISTALTQTAANDIYVRLDAKNAASWQPDGGTQSINGSFSVLGNLTLTGILTVPNEGLHLFDTGGDHDLIIKPGSDLSADRIFTLTTGDAARTLSVLGDLSITGNFTVGAATSITGGGTLALGGFTLTVPATGTAALLGTANVFTANQRINGRFIVSDTQTNVTGYPITNTISVTVAPGAASGAVHYASYGGITATGANNINAIYGMAFLSSNNSTGTLTVQKALDISNTSTLAAGIAATTNLWGLDIIPANKSGAGTWNIGTAYGVRIRKAYNPSGTLAGTTLYGLYIEDFSTPGGTWTNKHAVYVAGGLVYFGGNAGFGVTDPDTTVEIYEVGTQLKLSGGAADYATFAVAADGAMTITTVDADAALANIILDPDGIVQTTEFVRATTSLYRRYYHLSIASFDPGASGATWIDSDADTVGGWGLDFAGEELHAQVDVHADWDGASDLVAEVYFEINAASALNNTVDIKAEFFYKGVADAATKSQTVEVATNVGDGGAKARYTMFKAIFTIDWDIVDNVVEAGDILHMHINLETDTSEVDTIIVNKINYYYNTTHLGVESGDT